MAFLEGMQHILQFQIDIGRLIGDERTKSIPTDSDQDSISRRVTGPTLPSPIGNPFMLVIGKMPKLFVVKKASSAL